MKRLELEQGQLIRDTSVEAYHGAEPVAAGSDADEVIVKYDELG
jgi:hypothetical protein